MRTSKPIATISYNTEDFLKAKLEELLRNHTIDDYIYIHHDAEEDEKKDHFHVWISPNRLLDTMDLQDFFKEIDLKKPDKPLKCLPFSVSKLDDWILYGMHLPAYLATKGESREFVYSKDDFKFADEEAFERAYKHALKGSEWAQRNTVLQLIGNGEIELSQLILSGIVPLSMANQIAALDSLQRRGTFRNGRANHEITDNQDQETEEVKKVANIKKRNTIKKQAEKTAKRLKEAVSENPF